MLRLARSCWFSVALCFAGCNDNRTATDVVDSDTGGTGVGTSTEPSGGSSTGGVEMDSSMGSSTGNGDESDTDGIAGDRARVVFVERDDSMVHRLFALDYRGAETAPAVMMHGRLTNGSTYLGPSSTSPDRRWLAFRLFIAETNSQEMYLLDMTAEDFPAPIRVNVDPAPDPGIAANATFSPDGRFLAFVAGPDTSHFSDVLLVDLEGDLEPVRISPPLPPGGGFGSALAFSPNGSRIAYAADFEGDQERRLYLQQADTVHPGDPVLVGPSNGVSWWSPDGGLIGYRHDSDADGIAEFFVVDVSGTPGDPDHHDPAGIAGRGDVFGARWAKDGRGILYWLGESPLGDLWFVPMEGAAFGAPTRLNGAEQALSHGHVFSADSAKVLYLGVHDGPQESYLVALDGSGPYNAIKVNEDLAVDWNVTGHFFHPSDPAIFYFAGPGLTTEFRRVDIEGTSLGTPLKIEVPLDRGEGLAPSLIVSSAGDQVLLTSNVGPSKNLYWADVSSNNFGPAVRLNPQLPPGGGMTLGGRFSISADTVFYSASAGLDAPLWLYAVAPASPGVAQQLTAGDAVLSIQVFPLPR